MAKKIELVDGEIPELPGDGIIPAAAVTTPDPELIIVKALVHTMGLDAGDVVEIENTELVKGLIRIGHFVEVREKE